MAKEKKIEKQIQEESASNSIHGDMLEAILSHVPLIDLVPASHVSKSWNRAVFTSLSHLNKIKPWLLIHTQRKRSPYKTTTHAYDPRSHVWIQINQPSSITYISALRSSHSTLLYMLSPSKFAFSSDPLHLTWHHADPPLLWRTDPIVAAVDDKFIVVAGGTCELNFFRDDDPLAVEMYNVETRTWERCESMPSVLKYSSSATSLSASLILNKLYVTEKCSGVTFSFDRATKTWSGPYDLLHPDHHNVFFSVIASVNNVNNNRLILVGLIGEAEDVEGVKVWELSLDRDESLKVFKEIGEMPESFVEKLKRSGCDVPSIDVTAMGDFVYIHNPSSPEEIVICEIDGDGGCEWSSIKNVVASDENRIDHRLVFTCSSVGVGDLKCENRRFAIKESMGS